MDEHIRFLASLPDSILSPGFLKAAGLLVAGFLVISLLGRLIFGRRSVLNQSVSAAIGILFIYALTVVIHSYGLDLKFLVSPLPFLTISGDHVLLFSFQSDYVEICGQLLNMIILAFLVNLVDGWLPHGKHFLGWLFFRCISVLLAMLLHVVVHTLLGMLLPEGLLTWAPVILLGLLLLMLLLGALRFVVGAALTTVSPLIAVFYTFFFATILGKQISRAMLTTLLLSGMVYGLGRLGVSVIFIGAAALSAYIPFLLILLALWYLSGKVL